MKRHSTIANEAEKSIQELISHQNRIYKPWQLSEHVSENIKLSTTDDELKLLWAEPVFVRPGFHVDNRSVCIPNFLTKLSYDDQAFIEAFKAYVLDHPGKAVIYDHVDSINKASTNAIPEAEIRLLMNEHGLIDSDRFIQSELNPAKFMRVDYQRSLVEKLNLLISNRKEYFLAHVDYDPIFCIQTILQMNDAFYEMYHHFDYQYHNPKVMIIDDDKATLTKEAGMRLVFLLLLGFDVFIVAPQGYTSLENILTKDMYDLHYETGLDESPAKHETIQNPSPMQPMTSHRKKIYRGGALALIIFLALLFSGPGTQ